MARKLSIYIMIFLLLLLAETGCNSLSKIEIRPAPGSTLLTVEGESSEVILKTASVKKVSSERDYVTVLVDHTIKVVKGATIIEITGTVRNNHPTNHIISMKANAFDKNNETIAVTLDASFLVGVIEFSLEKGESGPFTLHLNDAEGIDHFEIFGATYSFPPP